MNIGKKILIMGGSCSGKSTLAEKLGTKLNIPVLHLDLLDPYAVNDEKGREIRTRQIQSKISETTQGKQWIIEGVYQWYAFEDRLLAANTMIILESSAFVRVGRYIKSCLLRQKRHGRLGFSAKTFSLNHVQCMLRKDDAPYDLIMKSARNHTNLNVIKLKSFKSINEFINNIQR